MPVPVVEASRAAILAAIGSPTDLTLVYGDFDVRDALAEAGARQLLAGHEHRSLRVAELAGARGQTGVLALGGDLCGPDFGVPVRALGVAELRFERVIVLPTTIDPSEDAVSEVLRRTRATVFAADPESHRQAATLCDARLAHPCAFLLDLGGRRGGGALGAAALNAFRTDGEQRLDVDLPPDNDDITGSLRGLDEWLAAIAAHSLIRTDRCELVTAAALLGKHVEYDAGLNPRLRALADRWLVERPVTEISLARHGRAPTPAPLAPETEHAMAQLRAAALAKSAPAPAGRRTESSEPRVTVVVVSRNRPRLAVRALESLAAAGAPHDVVVIDNNSAPAAAAALAAACRDRPRLRFRRLEQNTRAGGGRQLGAELVTTEFLLFLDDDAELLPGALHHLVAELDSHSQADAVTATVVGWRGTVMHSGGKLTVDPEVADFRLLGSGLRYDQLPPSGPADWIAGTAMLARTELLRRFRIDPAMTYYFEDNEWSYRVHLERPDSFRRSREAVALHQTTYKPLARATFAGRSLASDWLASLAHFRRIHGLLMGPWLFDLMPELRNVDLSPDLRSARLVMELAATRSTDWMFTAWMNGDLAGLLKVDRHG